MEVKKLVMCCVLGSMVSAPAVGAVKMNLDDGSVLTIGGYVKFDARYVDGDIGYQDYWTGGGGGSSDGSLDAAAGDEYGSLNFNVKESRFFIDVAKNGWSGRIEVDFYGGGGNQHISNSDKPRIRHAFMKNSNWLIGQSWTTFMPLHALAETLDFGGAHVAEVFIRQPQVRYSNGGFQFALETPETIGDGLNPNPNNDVPSDGRATSVVGTNAGIDPDENFPDIVIRYDFKGDWGHVSLGGLLRQIDPGDGPSADDSAFGGNIAGKINVGEKDDFKFEFNFGESGRYIATTMSSGDVVTTNSGLATEKREAKELTTYKFSFRHFWSDSLRSTIFYGQGEADEIRNSDNSVAFYERERGMFGVNLINQLTPNMWLGGEIGQYFIKDQLSATTEADLKSNYFQVSTKYVF